MSGGGSFTSDQSVAAGATADGQMVATGRRARVTYIQAEGGKFFSCFEKRPSFRNKLQHLNYRELKVWIYTFQAQVFYLKKEFI